MGISIKIVTKYPKREMMRPMCTIASLIKLQALFYGTGGAEQKYQGAAKNVLAPL